MGEETRKEEAKVEEKKEEKAEEKKEEKAEEKKEDKAEEKKEEKAEEKKEEKADEKKNENAEEKKEEPKPPEPVILFVDLHCVGCAKKIERSIMKFRGVEEVVMDMAQNQVTIKGIVQPQAICMRIQKKTKRRAKILSPLPAAEGDALPEVVTSQASGLTTVELNVNMHCEACAQQLKRKILKMRGVQTAETEMSTGKVMVTGTMDAGRLVDYVYRRTRKQARVVPQPEPVAEKNEEGEKPAEEAAKPEEKKEENAEKKDDNAEKKEEDKAPAEQENKGENNSGDNNENSAKEAKEGDENKEEKNNGSNNNEEEIMKRMMYYYPPLYVIERVPPPQLFSDENPNACCIT